MAGIPKSMQAVCVSSFGSEKVLQVDEIPVPALSQGKVLVKILSAGVNPVDTYIRQGAFGILPDLPFVPGKDGAGIVAAVGEDVKRFQKDDRVFVCIKAGNLKHGTYAEYTVVDEDHVFPLPENLTFDEGAAIGIPYFTAQRALFINGDATAGETVLVHGASGAVGLASIQIAKACGLCVIGTAGTPEGMELVKKIGADHVVSHKDKNRFEKIMELTDNKGVDIILEMLANVNLSNDLEILAPHGRVMVIGCRGSVSISPRLMMGPETKIIGVALLNSTKDEWQMITDSILKGIKSGYIKPVIDKRYSLEQAADAQRDIIKSKGAKGKLILTVSN